MTQPNLSPGDPMRGTPPRCDRPVPRAPSYPVWVPDDEDSRFRYDLALAIATSAMAEPPHSASARMAAEVVFRMPEPTR